MTQMSNPWLDITEGDYVGHMSSPAVDQRLALSHSAPASDKEFEHLRILASD